MASFEKSVGAFKLLPEEVEKAKKQGTLEQEQEKMRLATERLRDIALEKRSKEGIQSLEKYFAEHGKREE